MKDDEFFLIVAAIFTVILTIIAMTIVYIR